jgi:hypothetical protein
VEFPSGLPGFPVELGGFVALHAAFLDESRTRGPVQCNVAGNPGPANLPKGKTAHGQVFDGS